MEEHPGLHKLVLDIEGTVVRLAEEKKARHERHAVLEKENKIMAQEMEYPRRRSGFNSRNSGKPPGHQPRA
ncbi:MAG: hypothetical protein OXE85_13800 [Roseovarius sp.]|nr:hypothetical protein [Roseovarius sp.]